MKARAFFRVVLPHDVPQENLLTGDVGTVVEIYNDTQGNTVGHELELFAANGETLAVATVPADAV